MQHQQKSLGWVAPAQGFKSITVCKQNYNTLGAERACLAEIKEILCTFSFNPKPEGSTHLFLVPRSCARFCGDWRNSFKLTPIGLQNAFELWG